MCINFIDNAALHAVTHHAVIVVKLLIKVTSAGIEIRNAANVEKLDILVMYVYPPACPRIQGQEEQTSLGAERGCMQSI